MSSSSSPCFACHSIWRLPSPPGTSRGATTSWSASNASRVCAVARYRAFAVTATEPGPSHPGRRSAILRALLSSRVTHSGVAKDTPTGTSSRELSEREIDSEVIRNHSSVRLEASRKISTARAIIVPVKEACIARLLSIRDYRILVYFTNLGVQVVQYMLTFDPVCNRAEAGEGESQD
jgi:hypothetical protein